MKAIGYAVVDTLHEGRIETIADCDDSGCSRYNDPEYLAIYTERRFAQYEKDSLNRSLGLKGVNDTRFQVREVTNIVTRDCENE